MPISFASRAERPQYNPRAARGLNADIMANMRHRSSALATLAVVLITVAFFDLALWVWEGKGGWDFDDNLFNWHPVLMVVSMVLLATFSATSYQVDPMNYGMPKDDRSENKMFHVVVMAVAVFLAILGMAAVIGSDSTDDEGWGFHQWMGAVALFIVAQNFTLGFFKFLAKYELCFSARDYLPTHRTLGIVALVCTHLAAISGAWLMGDCATGCTGGTLIVFCLTVSMFCVLGSLHPAFLHPERLCADKLDHLLDEIEHEFEPHAPTDESRLISHASNDAYESVDSNQYGSARSSGSVSSYSSYDTGDSNPSRIATNKSPLQSSRSSGNPESKSEKSKKRKKDSKKGKNDVSAGSESTIDSII